MKDIGFFFFVKLQNSESRKLLFKQDTVSVQGFYSSKMILQWQCLLQVSNISDLSLKCHFFSFPVLFPKGGGCWAPQKLTGRWLYPLCPLIFIFIIFLSSAVCGRIRLLLLHSYPGHSAALISLAAPSWWSTQLRTKKFTHCV